MTNKITASAIVLMSAAVLVALIWVAGKREQASPEPELRFAQETQFPFEEVRSCLRSGNGGSIFSDLTEVSALRMSDIDNAMFMSEHSLLVIRKNHGRTMVHYRSDVPLSDVQRDLLQWCIDHPTTTWIPAGFR